jgi:two-component system chemotaxis response regulator CheB
MGTSSHDIVVIGASAGGSTHCTPDRRLLPNLPAAIFIVQHLAPDMPNFLPRTNRAKIDSVG